MPREFDPRRRCCFLSRQIEERLLSSNRQLSAEAGKLAGLSLAGTNPLGLGETLELSAQYGIRLRKAQLGITKPLSADKRIQAGVDFYGQRYWYDQARDASILALDRNVTEAKDIDPNNLLKYALRSYGATTSVRVVPARRLFQIRGGVQLRRNRREPAHASNRRLSRQVRVSWRSG